MCVFFASVLLPLPPLLLLLLPFPLLRAHTQWVAAGKLPRSIRLFAIFNPKQNKCEFTDKNYVKSRKVMQLCLLQWCASTTTTTSTRVFSLPVVFDGGSVNVIGLGDNSTEWNIIGILFTNEKVACVDTENNELNQVLHWRRRTKKSSIFEAYKQKKLGMEKVFHYPNSEPYFFESKVQL